MALPGRRPDVCNFKLIFGGFDPPRWMCWLINLERVLKIEISSLLL
jgi:hypothetical protein